MKIAISSFLATLILKFIYMTVRWTKIHVPKKSEELLLQKRGFVLALWHNQIPFIIDFTYKFYVKRYGLEVIPMASQSKDGELITRVIAHFGMKPKRGSSKKGGAAALKALVQDARKGSISLITPDGPTGPVYTLKPGIVQLASMTGFPILSYFAKYDHYRIVQSWDRTPVPKLFSKAEFFISEPFYVPKLKGEKELEVWRKKLETFMLDQVGISRQYAESLREEVKLAAENKRKAK
ncbi:MULTISPECIES: lysophospholipid acyltransferase family protein [unclassified Leptospira]|uniref:lysophospholipid acyltransferase family protein n=1 Tax=unclassified Leptospira TaxID=2633828 RepID=UPI0002BFB528|nr:MULTISPECIES: lysophospholipid acyltransferase family protein [unclassified Leptospira]EMJ98893.1 PF04028 domain protein [Leptospira sp. B5-022]MCR1794098.1 lysophospholipid acyltransferase family protein [Leptospira sp. id769339]